MSLNPQPPIIVDENGDIAFYESLSDAARALEAVDVIAGEYEIFDSCGLRLRAMVADGEPASVTVRASEAAKHEDAELAVRLRNFVERVGPERVGVTAPGTAQLSELVSSLASFLGSGAVLPGVVSSPPKPGLGSVKRWWRER